jgi:CRP-like cAMP-binding protein
MFRNHTLMALDGEDRTSLFPHLVERRVQRGEVLTGQGDKVANLYFPASAYLANIVTFHDGRSAEAFIIGREGISGLGAFLADEPCAWTVEVKAPGEVYELAASVLRRRMNVSPTLRDLLMRVTYDNQAQAALTVSCATLHAIPERLARLLLTSTERLEQEQLHITQEDLAGLLGVQRTSVNAAAQELKEAGAILYNRGVIRVVDRGALERRACECVRLYRSLHSDRDVPAPSPARLG